MTIVNKDYFNLDEILLEFGNGINLSGAVFSDHDRTIILMFPDNEVDYITIPDVSLEDWKRILRQTDLLETEVLINDNGGIKKAILRKSGRQIDGRISWKVFKRDGYACRYCGNDDVPLTVDHLVLWEEGGPSIEENLVSACGKCNKKRGNMQYGDWLASQEYISRSANLDPYIIMMNSNLLETLDGIPRKLHIQSRGKKKKRARK